MEILYSFFVALALTILMFPLLKVYQLENYRIKNYLSRVLKFNFAFGDKNDLKFTKRILRMIFCAFLLIFCIYILIFCFIENVYVELGLIFAGLLFLPFLLSLAHFVIFPVEKMVMCYYLSKAKKKLKMMPCRKIAITGSFGKTSTKNILFKILSEKYRTCATPKSYNTPMGICMTILNKLSPLDDFFIVEMGARHKGDISFLCNLIGADYGILTPVGKCHIETFKTLDNVENTKFELCQNVKDFMVINGKSESNLRLYDKCEKKKYLICKAGSFAYADDIKFLEGKARFVLYIDNKSVLVSTKLLGRANVDNIVVASSLAYLLGLNLLDIKKGIENLTPIPHRLELVKGYATVIDDSYNSNYEGFKQALEVLESFNGQKILVTPGMVELGREQEKLNYDIAMEIAKVCDKVIVMNKVNKTALTDGLRDGKFNMKNVLYANTRQEQKELLKSIITKDSVVLFENDLPDNYQ